MLSRFFNRKKPQVRATPAVEPAVPAQSCAVVDYATMPRAQAHEDFFKALLADDTGTMNRIRAAYPSAVTWQSLVNPSSTASSQPIPLIHYAAVGNGDALRWLIDRGADVECVDTWWFKCTPLYLAASRGNLVTVEMLLKAGADPYAQSLFKNYYDMVEEATRFGYPQSTQVVALITAARTAIDAAKKPSPISRKPSFDKQ